MDIKKLPRIPNGGGHRIHGRVQGEVTPRARNLASGWPKDRGRIRGYSFLHFAVDDHSRFAYSEVLTDETMETASAFRAPVSSTIDQPLKRLSPPICGDP